jgi:TATA-box binding protein (TBP) (component of TFIID and TFIIIB)
MQVQLDEEWENFLNNVDVPKAEVAHKGEAPAPNPIIISTMTFIAYLNSEIDLEAVFWKIPVIAYAATTHGVVKKQFKISSSTPENVRRIETMLEQYDYTVSNVMVHQEQPKFKDVRKISIGLSFHDFLSCQGKKKGAFYNCFVLILRTFVNKKYKEFHVKVFNTGKIEIPGIQTRQQLQSALDVLLAVLRQAATPVEIVADSEHIVLINSNFNCNFFINRQELYKKLKHVYGIQALYDPCSYPGIQCKLYVENDAIALKKTQEGAYDVSVMIFRTGSVLIVGKFKEELLPLIYDFLNAIFKSEYASIMECAQTSQNVAKAAKTKSLRKMILV